MLLGGVGAQRASGCLLGAVVKQQCLGLLEVATLVLVAQLALQLYVD